MQEKHPILLQVKNLQVSFLHKGTKIPALRGVSFTLFSGETLGIVGESGSGKSTTLLGLTGLLRDAEITGSADFCGIDLLHNSHKVLGTKIGMVFQDPVTCLNPTMKIGKQIEEGLLFHRLANRKEAKLLALTLLQEVEIHDPEVRMEQYPHELSGGQRQRVAIAIALACQPKLFLADEPTTALDTHTKMQVVSLFHKLQQKLKMGCIWVSHDLDLMGQIADRLLIFYNGIIVEEGLTQEVLTKPQHPYTQMLINAKPKGHYTDAHLRQTFQTVSSR